MGRRFTLLELLVTLAIVAILAAIAIPALRDMTMRAREAEVRPNLISIVDATLAYQIGTDNASSGLQFAPAGGAGKQRRPWTGAGWFNTIGWSPDGDVYATYQMHTTGIGATTCSTDGISGANADSAMWGPYSLYATSFQDLDGDGEAVLTLCCESTTLADYNVESTGSCGKGATTGTGGPVGGIW